MINLYGQLNPDDNAAENHIQRCIEANIAMESLRQRYLFQMKYGKPSADNVIEEIDKMMSLRIREVLKTSFAQEHK